jgi:hypothetical protein
MAVLVDSPIWPAHGRLWAHLVSDTSLDELHEFADALGIPRRGFDLDHYDIPEEYVERAISAGAEYLPARELLKRLIDSGLRVSAKSRRSR